MKRTTHPRRPGGKLSRPPARRPGSRGNARTVRHGLASADFRAWFRQTRAAIEARLEAADAQADPLDPHHLAGELRLDARRLLVLIGLLEARALEAAGDDAALAELADRLGRLSRSLARVRGVQVGLALRCAGLADGGPSNIPADVDALKERLVVLLDGGNHAEAK